MSKKCEGCGKPATWKAWFLKQMRGTFGKGGYYCNDCLLDDLNGVHTGGGPYISCFMKLKRIALLVKAERLNAKGIKPSDIFYNVKPENNHW